ncbi:MAG: winged helix-turn-helix transcriptional regulator [Actinobacteria bacterium]|nr:MAG: winged helix-turn-helix transcriptional regulator [Actinomycetota bacterium]
MRDPSSRPPIGLHLARAARVVTGAFERSMTDAGCSASAWQVLVLIRAGHRGTQSEMAESMGITDATLTYHLNALEEQGFVRRWRDPSNRRVQQAELTESGEALFARLRAVAAQHDRRLRSALSEGEAELLAELLDKLQAGVEGREPAVAGRRARAAPRSR